MIRVCMVAFARYSIDSRIRREAEALIERGNQVDAIGLEEDPGRRVYTIHGVRVYAIPVSRYRGDSSVFYLLNYFQFFVEATILLTYLYLKETYQVIQIHTLPDFMVFVALIPKLFGAKIILDVHDLMPELYQSKFGLKPTNALIRFLTWVERFSIGFAHAAIAVHQPHCDLLVRHGNPRGKFLILLNLPDPKIFADARRSQVGRHARFKMVYHGTLAKRNGLDLAIRAVALLRDELPDLRLNIIGEGDALPELVRLVESEELNPHVHIFPGFVPLEKLLPVIIDADVGIAPIISDDFTRYMLPVKLLEYVALGIPVICSRTETIQAYFDDSMVEYFTPGDPVDLANHIRILFTNLGRRRWVAANADQYNRKYSWTRQKQAYFELIDKLTVRELFSSESM